MCKGVGNLPHYQSRALAYNQRYLEAVMPVDNPTAGYDDQNSRIEPKLLWLIAER